MRCFDPFRHHASPASAVRQSSMTDLRPCKLLEPFYCVVHLQFLCPPFALLVAAFFIKVFRPYSGPVTDIACNCAPSSFILRSNRHPKEQVHTDSKIVEYEPILHIKCHHQQDHFRCLSQPICTPLDGSWKVLHSERPVDDQYQASHRQKHTLHYNLGRMLA